MRNDFNDFADIIRVYAHLLGIDQDHRLYPQLWCACKRYYASLNKEIFDKEIFLLNEKIKGAQDNE